MRTFGVTGVLHDHPKLNTKHMTFSFMGYDKVLFMAIYSQTREKAVQHSDCGYCDNAPRSTNIINLF